MTPVLAQAWDSSLFWSTGPFSSEQVPAARREWQPGRWLEQGARHADRVGLAGLDVAGDLSLAGTVERGARAGLALRDTLLLFRGGKLAYLYSTVRIRTAERVNDLMAEVGDIRAAVVLRRTASHN